MEGTIFHFSQKIGLKSKKHAILHTSQANGGGARAPPPPPPPPLATLLGLHNKSFCCEANKELDDARSEPANNIKNTYNR